MTMTSVGEGREQKGFPAEINEGSCHYNEAFVRLTYRRIPALYLIYVIHEGKCLLSTQMFSYLCVSHSGCISYACIFLDTGRLLDYISYLIICLCLK